MKVTQVCICGVYVFELNAQVLPMPNMWNFLDIMMEYVCDYIEFQKPRPYVQSGALICAMNMHRMQNSEHCSRNQRAQARKRMRRCSTWSARFSGVMELYLNVVTSLRCLVHCA
jgi:hypothetical protein